MGDSIGKLRMGNELSVSAFLHGEGDKLFLHAAGSRAKQEGKAGASRVGCVGLLLCGSLA